MNTLQGHGLSVSTNGRLLIDGIDVTGVSGSITAVVGPNGAGKSTLLAAIARLQGTGIVRLGGADLDALTRRDRAKRVALVQQSTETEVDLTVRDAVELGRTPHRSTWGDDHHPDAVDEALHAVGMAAFADRSLASLSGGERQRVAIGMAIAQQPRLLLVDEPSNHLDIAAQLAVMALLRELADTGTTIVVALHDLSLALQFSDAALVLSRGIRIASGPTAQTLTADLISTVYGVAASIVVDPASGHRAVIYAPRSEGSAPVGAHPVEAQSRELLPAAER